MVLQKHIDRGAVGYQVQIDNPMNILPFEYWEDSIAFSQSVPGRQVRGSVFFGLGKKVTGYRNFFLSEQKEKVNQLHGHLI